MNRKWMIALLLGLLPLAGYGQEVGADVLQYVDPTIGGASALLQPTRPTIHLPNQMIRMVPSRADMLDDWIADYPLTMVSHRRESVFGLLPFCSQTLDNLWDAKAECDREVFRPYEYKADLEGVTFEFAPSRKSGIVRVSFEGAGRHVIRLRTLNPIGSYVLQGRRVVTGEASFEGMKAYLYAEFDADFTPSAHTDRHDRLLLETQADWVMMRYGLSYISVAQARENLSREIPTFDFDRVCHVARNVWAQRMGQIQAEGGTKAHLRTFYTALYRCSERMVDINEYGRYYSAYDHQVHVSDKPFYVDNWIWDTHIALEPLQTILNPTMEVDKINSYIEMYKQGGVMPSFAVTTGDWPAMTGNYAAVWMADAWAKGLRFDLSTAYRGLRANSLDATLLPWRNGPRTAIDDFYSRRGYYPALRPGEKEYISEVDTTWERRQAVSVTTANSYSDWCIAQLAKVLNKTDDAALFLKRAANYRNVFRQDKGFMWPKDSAGNWIEPYDPRYADRKYFTENNAYIFNWDVKHDLQGLVTLMGGRAKAFDKLDHLFHEDIGMAKFNFFHILPDATGLVGEFQMGNEPGFHIPYLYDYLGAPWKTQKRVHQLIDAFYSDTLFGMPGDEDGGGMSAFVVFSMMGFFPVTSGVPVYAVGSPFFASVTISLPGKKCFLVKTENFSEKNKYIQSATLNGKALTRPWFTHDDMKNGGTLTLVMGETPNRQWGVREEDAPPSALDINMNKIK